MLFLCPLSLLLFFSLTTEPKRRLTFLPFGTSSVAGSGLSPPPLLLRAATFSRLRRTTFFPTCPLFFVIFAAPSLTFPPIATNFPRGKTTGAYESSS